MSQQPNLLQGPEPVETADLHFKQLCKLKIFETQTKYEDGHCNLVAVSQYYGLIFARKLNGFSVIKTKSISATTEQDSFPRIDVPLNHKPTHLAVDFSQKVLAVVCTLKPGAVLFLYNISSFTSKDVLPVKVTSVSSLVQNIQAEVSDISWQPNSDSELTMCMSDGSVVTITQPTGNGNVFNLPGSTRATCLCWSPKGKQIVIGCADGTLSQYKPNLKVVKTLPPPPLFNGSVMVIKVLWISSYQFAVAYNDRNNQESFPVITIVNAAKNEPVNVINYDDITYSSTLFRNHQIYMSHQSPWNLIFVSSANSIEVAVLHSKDGTSWEQWLLGDASRAELPLNPDRQETFPLGWAFDFTSQETIPWGEGTLPPMPRLLLLSDEGLLCIYNIVNAAEGAPQLCEPPKEIIEDSFFTVPKASAPTAVAPTAVAPLVVSQPAAVAPISFAPQASSVFGNLKPTYNFGSASTFGGLAAQSQSTPQVTISIQGGPVLGGVKDAQLILQQQQQQQFQQKEQSVAASTQSIPSATTLKLSTLPQFGTSATPFSFGASSTSSLFAAKAAAVSENVPVTKFGAPPGNLFTGKPLAPQGDIFAGKNLLQSTPIKQPEVVIEKTAPKPAPPPKIPDEVVESAGKPEEAPGKGKSPGESPEPGTPELAAVDDSVYWNALQEEIEHFNSELQQLSGRVSTLNIQVGTQEDKKKMKDSIDTLYEFWKELKETTESQKSEIHSVVMDLMESFAWLEDAKSRNLQRKNPSYIELKKSEELDPISARHMSDIAHFKYYIENQLKQLTSYLEKEWMDHQESYRMEVKNRMIVPPLEEVYKTMHFQLKILSKQRALVEELQESIVQKKKKNKSQALLITNSSPIVSSSNGTRVSELSKLAENLLQLRINREESSPKSQNWDVVKAQLQAISERSKKLTEEKQMALRDALSERDTMKISPVKTTFESSSFLRSLSLIKATKPQPKEKEKPDPSFAKPKAPVTPQVTPTPTVTPALSQPKTEAQPVKADTEQNTTNKTAEPSKGIFVFGAPAPSSPIIPLTVQSLPAKPEEKSPLASLFGIVSSIGMKGEAKPKPPASTFVFGSSTFQNQEPVKETVVFGSAKPPEQKPKEEKTFSSFGISKPSESIFGKNETPKFGTKLTFGMTPSTPLRLPTTKPETVTKTTTAPNVSVITAPTATTTTATTSAASAISAFTFGAKPLITSTNLPKMNLLFSGKEQTSVFATPTTGSLFSAASTSAQSTTASILDNSTPVFGSAPSKPLKSILETSATPLISGTKVADAPVQSTGFTFSQTTDNKTKSPTAVKLATEPVVVTPSASEPEEVDVVTVEEPAKKPESTPEAKAKESPKPTLTPSIFGGTPETPKSSLQISSSSAAPPNVQVVSTPQSSVTVATTNVFTKPAATTSATTETPTISASVASTKAAATSATTTSVFSFSTSSLVFGQTATTTAVTTTTSIFGQGATTTSSVFGQVSSTTPTTNIFGGSTSTTPTTNIFGGSTPTSKPPVFAQAVTPTTTSAGIFGASTPTTNTFGQPSTPGSPSSFGQNPDPVGQTANIFGQLLSDSNRQGSVFGTTSGTTTTTGNIFSNQKNIFGGGSSFGGTTSSSIFSQTTTVFGQPTTSASIFGQSQPQTSTSSSFFGQNVCSPFGGSTSVTSNQSTFESGGFTKPVFGQSVFGQSTSNTSTFGSPSIFGGSTGTNVFQTPTTSSTFGSTPSGPFSSSQGSVAETGFGAAATFQKPMGGFGSPPVFGSHPAPAFGASPTFGGSASFGSLPTFGNRSFESSPSSNQATFGQSPGRSTTFENLASQNTVGFGNLAQRSQSQGFGGPVGGFGSSSFENKPAFGGDAFSSWRS